MIVIQDFERLIGGNCELRDIALDIQLGPAASVYLAFENSRVAVATVSHSRLLSRRPHLTVAQVLGLFIIHLPDTPTDPNSATASAPRVTISNVPWFGDINLLSCISCLQMTDTSLLVNWDPAPGRVDLYNSYFKNLVIRPTHVHRHHGMYI